MIDSFLLTDKKAIVTGAGRGIGQAIASALAEAGAEVGLVARTPLQLEETQSLITDAGGVAHVIPADVTDRAAVDGAVATALGFMGDLDIVVNSAGTGVLRPLVYVEGMKFPGWQAAVPEANNSAWDESMRDEDWDFVLNANCRSILYVAQAAGPHMLTKRSGRFISVISCYYDVAPPYHGAYSVSKAAAHMLTRCLATEWAPFNVTVNGIAPGNVDTELNEAAMTDPELLPFLDMIPLKRAAQPREIGLLAVYLASGASAFMTGETVVIDGGELSRGLGL